MANLQDCFPSADIGYETAPAQMKKKKGNKRTVLQQVKVQQKQQLTPIFMAIVYDGV